MRKKTVVQISVCAALLVVLAVLMLVRLKAADALEAAEKQAAEATPTPIATPVPMPTPSAEPESGLPRINVADWQYVLVNAAHPLGNVEPESLTELEGGHSFDSRAAASLQKFIDAARAEGLSVCLSSAYRNYNEQSYLYNRKVQQLGGDEAAAARIVTPPGASEHQLGLCADITDRFYEVKTHDLENTALFQWMQAHCQEYGFILRYPKDKEEITGIMYEPWHFRYVGVEAATYIMENGLCLEEFLALYETTSE